MSQPNSLLLAAPPYPSVLSMGLMLPPPVHRWSLDRPGLPAASTCSAGTGPSLPAQATSPAAARIPCATQGHVTSPFCLVLESTDGDGIAEG